MTPGNKKNYFLKGDFHRNTFVPGELRKIKDMIFQGDIALGSVGQFPQHFLKIRDAAAAAGNIEIKSIGKSRDKVRESFAAQGQQRFPAAARARQGQEVKLPVHAHDHRDLFFLIKIFPRDIFQKKFMQVFF